MIRFWDVIAHRCPAALSLVVSHLRSCTVMAFPLDIQFVKRTEVKLRRKLPLGYVAKMCRDNGGEVATGTDHWWLYPIFDDSDRKRLKRTCNDIVRETAQAREWPDFPAEALAIRNNGGGDQLVLLADPETDRYADAVYWWDHETGELDKVAERSRNCLATVANQRCS
jgi:hypothetical protein